MRPPVLLVVHDFLPQAVAGTELHVLRLARELSRRHPLRIFHTMRDPARAQYTLERTFYDGLPVTRVVQNYPYRPLLETRSDPALERLFRLELEHLRPAVVHFHHLAFLPLSLPALARESGAATVFTLHDYHLACPAGGQLAAHPDGRLCEGPDPERCGPCHAHYGQREGRLEALALRIARMPLLPAGLPFRLYRRLPTPLKALLKRLNPPPGAPVDPPGPAAGRRWEQVREVFEIVDRFVAPSRDLAARFQGWGLPADRLVLLPNPGPSAPAASSTTGGERSPGSPVPLPPAPPLRLLFLGTLVPHKGLHRVVEAVGRFRPEELQLEVCGDPDAFPVYSRQVRRRAAPNVTFRGLCPPEEVGPRLAAAHALVMGSLWPENAPLTVLEAFAAGRPVVAPRLGGIPEQLRDGIDGLLFDSDDSDGLASALRRLLLEPDLLPRLAAGVRPPMTAEEYAARLEALYDEAIRAREASL